MHTDEHHLRKARFDSETARKFAGFAFARSASSLDSRALESRGPHNDHGLDDHSSHSMARYGRNSVADRTVGSDVHDPAGNRERWGYIFRVGDPVNTDPRPLGVWLGLSHCRIAGLLCMAAE